jgi:secondary thiamine-phosphate synthase enzyme
MDWFKDTLQITSEGKGLYPVTDLINQRLQEWNLQVGMCFLFLPHASASLVISESYDPSARVDVEAFYERLVPEGQTWYRHTLEGADDSPSHIRATLTQVSLSIPVENCQLALGTWQGVFLFEHRVHSHQRRIDLRGLKVN